MKINISVENGIGGCVRITTPDEITLTFLSALDIRMRPGEEITATGTFYIHELMANGVEAGFLEGDLTRIAAELGYCILKLPEALQAMEHIANGLAPDDRTVLLLKMAIEKAEKARVENEAGYFLGKDEAGAASQR